MITRKLFSYDNYTPEKMNCKILTRARDTKGAIALRIFLQSIRNSHRDLASFPGGGNENNLAAKTFCPALDVF